MSKNGVRNVNTIMKDFKKMDEKLDFLHKNSYRILRDVATSGGAKRIADEKRDVLSINKGAFLIKTPRDKNISHAWRLQ